MLLDGFRGSEGEAEEMKFYISTTGIKRVTISKSGKGSTTTAAAAAASNRRISIKAILPLVLVLGVVLPFVFVRVAFLVLESATVCSSLGKSSLLSLAIRFRFPSQNR